MQRQLIGGVAFHDGNTGRVFGGFVVGRPIHGGTLHEPVAHAAAFKNDRGIGGFAVAAGAGVRDTDFIESCD